MKPLTREEICDLLETMTLDEISEKEAHRLDKEGREALSRFVKEMDDAENHFQSLGKRMRETHPIPGIKLPSRSKTKGFLAWWTNHSIPNWVSITVSLIFLSFFLPQVIEPGASISIVAERTGPSYLADIEKVNRNLVIALIERSEFLIDTARQKPEYYLEAVSDLLQAYQLEENNQQVLSYLIIAYEKLGDRRNAKKYFEKWKNLNLNNDSED